MKKKILIVLTIILAVAGIGSAIYFYIQFNNVSAERDTLVQQNAVLQNTIDAIGPTTTAYTVAAPVTWRDIIHKEDFVEILMPTANMTEDTVTDLSTIEDKLYKINIQPGTPITNSMVMTDEFDDTIYEKDLVFDYLPLGLKVGDFVNVQLSYPFGQTFLVIPHIRVDQVVVDSNVIKTHFNETYAALWESARREYSLLHDKGLSLYLEKYVEPGIDEDEVVAFYPVIADMEATVNANPNIPDASLCVNSTLRTQIDQMISGITDNDGSLLSSGVSTEASSLNAAQSTYVEDGEQSAQPASESISENQTDTIDLESGESAQTTVKTDADGNASNITDEQKDNSTGGSLFGDETTLE